MWIKDDMHSFLSKALFFHLQNLNEEELLQRIILKIKWDYVQRVLALGPGTHYEINQC